MPGKKSRELTPLEPPNTPCLSQRKYHCLWSLQGWSSYLNVCLIESTIISVTAGVVFIPLVCLTENTIISVTTGVVFIPQVCLIESTIISVTTGVLFIPHVCLTESTIICYYRGGLYTPFVSHRKYHYLWSLQGWSLFPMCVSLKVPLSLVTTGVVSILHVCLTESTIISVATGVVSIPHVCLTEVPVLRIPQRWSLYSMACLAEGTITTDDYTLNRSSIHRTTYLFAVLHVYLTSCITTVGHCRVVSTSTNIQCYQILAHPLFCFFSPPPPPPPFFCHWPKCDCSEQRVVCCYQPVYGRNKTC